MTWEKVRRSGDLLEYWKYERTPIGYQRGRLKRTEGVDSSRKRYKKHVRRRPDNVRRAAAAFRRLVRANLVGTENPALLTLTMLQILPIKTSGGLLTEFFVRARTRFGKQFKYIAVPEFQQRGAVHYHVIIFDSPYIPNAELNNMWGHGYSFIEKSYTDVFHLSNYMTKYLTKERDRRLYGKRAYFPSRSLLRPVTTLDKESIAFNRSLLDGIIPDYQGRSKSEYNPPFKRIWDLSKYPDLQSTVRLEIEGINDIIRQ